MSNGFYTPALGALTNKMESNYAKKKIENAILRVVRNGEICYENAVGYADADKKTPLTPKSIYRVFSMSKPITMATLMTLYEKGLVYPEDTLESFFPEMKDMPVAVEQPDGTVELEKQKRPITIHDLFTMTSGLPYPGDDCAAARMFKEQMLALEAGDSSEPVSLKQIIQILAGKCALCFQPGSQWRYGYSHDVIGAVIEEVTGLSLGSVMRKAIFEPLGMTDTDFWVPESKLDRFVTPYSVENDEWQVFTDIDDYRREPSAPSGGGGLVSTLDDYMRFCRMLTNGGTLDGVRVLGRKTIAMMAANQLSDEQMKTFSWRERGYGYAVGMRTMIHPWILNGSAGEFGWDGMMGTYMAADPAENLSVVYLQNMMPYNDRGLRLMPIIYGALI